jgi:NYN domain
VVWGWALGSAGKRKLTSVCYFHIELVTMSSGKVFQSYAYVDGAYLREEGARISVPYPNPRMIVHWVNDAIQSIGGRVLVRRISFYDAEPSEQAASREFEQYWEFVERQFDTDLRFGELRGKPRRQKGVDVLLAVDMLAASFRQAFDVAILIAGDADFVPLIHEVRRHGVTVVVAGVRDSTAREMQTAADRFVALDSVNCPAWAQEPFTPQS